MSSRNRVSQSSLSLCDFYTRSGCHTSQSHIWKITDELSAGVAKGENYLYFLFHFLSLLCTYIQFRDVWSRLNGFIFKPIISTISLILRKWQKPVGGLGGVFAWVCVCVWMNAIDNRGQRGPVAMSWLLRDTFHILCCSWLPQHAKPTDLQANEGARCQLIVLVCQVLNMPPSHQWLADGGGTRSCRHHTCSLHVTWISITLGE